MKGAKLCKCLIAPADLIVDDNAFMRRALGGMLKRQQAFDVCGEASNGREAIEKAQVLLHLASSCWIMA
jgi:DNA-binding NarL/FixJ family response regulator